MQSSGEIPSYRAVTYCIPVGVEQPQHPPKRRSTALAARRSLIVPTATHLTTANAARGRRPWEIYRRTAECTLKASDCAKMHDASTSAHCCFSYLIFFSNAGRKFTLSLLVCCWSSFSFSISLYLILSSKSHVLNELLSVKGCFRWYFGHPPLLSIRSSFLRGTHSCPPLGHEAPGGR